LDRPDLQELLKKIGCSTMLNYLTVHNLVDINACVRDSFTRWFHPQPRTFVSSTRSNTGRNPFAFGYLSFDGQVKIRVCVSNAENMCFCSFNPYGMSCALVDFNVSWSNEFFDVIYISSVNDFIDISTDEQLVFSSNILILPLPYAVCGYEFCHRLVPELSLAKSVQVNCAS
jgi:hypothetical protein